MLYCLCKMRKAISIYAKKTCMESRYEKRSLAGQNARRKRMRWDEWLSGWNAREWGVQSSSVKIDFLFRWKRFRLIKQCECDISTRKKQKTYTRRSTPTLSRYIHEKVATEKFIEKQQLNIISYAHSQLSIILGPSHTDKLPNIWNWNITRSFHINALYIKYA